MDTTLLTTAGLGFVLGLRHALDPDHLVAVSTLVSERGGGPRTSLVGGFWGLGHALTLLAGSAVVLALKLQRLASSRAGWRRSSRSCSSSSASFAAGGGARRPHPRPSSRARRLTTSTCTPIPPAVARRDRPPSPPPVRGGLRPFAVGLVHGLAGSAGVALMAVGAARTVLEGLLYAGMLGLGARRMLALTALFSLPLDRVRRRFDMFQRRAARLLASAGFGLWLFGVHAAETLGRR
jgi:high-affinity nickel-transport protein